jgi:hypothetical protein
VRYFFTRLEPKASRILLIESGSRYLLEGLISGIRTTYGTEILVDLVDLLSRLARGLRRRQHYRLPGHRLPRARRTSQALSELARNRYSIAV